MDSIGRFLEMESNGKPFLVYHHPKYHPIAQTESPTSSGDAANHQPLFICPFSRTFKDKMPRDCNIFPIISSPEYTEQDETTNQENYHSVLPLFWCNNKEFDIHGECGTCKLSNFGTDYYRCVYCKRTLHKECVQAPTEIKHPYHPEHSLKLYFILDDNIVCLCCGRKGMGLVYKCAICDAFMHTTCAMKSILVVEDQPKSHHHPLTVFPRQASLTCNVCGLVRKFSPTYVCLKCNFVAHDDCMYSPRIIKISRHPHRISYFSSLSYGKWSCGVCRQSIRECYGAYACVMCFGYVVHTTCALGKDIWDGKELDCVPEEEDDDITQDPGPFAMMSEGMILHFLHGHNLRFEVSVLFDENKFCQACVLPIYEGNLYSCVECDFVVHETCSKNRRRIQHALHAHPLALDVVRKDDSGYNTGYFICKACKHYCSGFVYMCPRKECDFKLDVRCASISEPFDYHGHERHPLFLALDLKEKLFVKEKPICQVCGSHRHMPLNCIECDFIVCMRCATLPYEARYKCEEHLLKNVLREEVCEKDWCEVCERNLKDTNTKLFYRCNECSITIHIECLLGIDPYLKPGQYLVDLVDRDKFEIFCKSPVSRPLCDHCKKPCQGRIYKDVQGRSTACSYTCVFYVA